MNVHAGPIGIFDSGLGGLSVAAAVQAELPHEQICYVADSRFCPYGERSPVEIRWRSGLVADALIQRGAKLLIVACNTATAVALEDLRARLSVPVIGLEPALKPAVALSATGRIGILVTTRTAASSRLKDLIDRFGADATVHVVPAPGLVDLVERGLTDGPLVERHLRPLVEPLLTQGVDTIVLGCTHYPALHRAITAIAGEGVRLVDSGAAIGRRAAKLLAANSTSQSWVAPGELELLTTGDPALVSAVAALLLGRPITAAHLDLPVNGDHLAPLEPNCSAV